MKYLYLLSHKKYFSMGSRGRVTHALGIVDGLEANGHKVTLISDPNSKNYLPSQINLIEHKALFWMAKILLILKVNLSSYDKLLVRWRPVLPFLLLFILRKSEWRKVIIELNDFSGVHSRNVLLRVIYRSSLSIVCSRCKLFVVSEDAKVRLLKIYPSAWITVVENGISREFIESNANIDYKIDPKTRFNLIYFGGFQNYYDWNVVRAINSTRNLKYDFTLEIYGFEELPGLGKHGNGRYRNTHLMNDIFEKHTNPILILPGSDTIQANMGFPTKLNEYLYVGCPVLASDIYEGRVPKDAVNWYFYSTGDPNSAIKKLSKLIDNYPKNNTSGYVNRKIASAHSWSNNVKSIL